VGWKAGAGWRRATPLWQYIRRAVALRCGAAVLVRCAAGRAADRPYRCCRCTRAALAAAGARRHQGASGGISGPYPDLDGLGRW
jgi:hypothetical protein